MKKTIQTIRAGIVASALALVALTGCDTIDQDIALCDWVSIGQGLEAQKAYSEGNYSKAVLHRVASDHYRNCANRLHAEKVAEMGRTTVNVIVNDSQPRLTEGGSRYFPVYNENPNSEGINIETAYPGKSKGNISEKTWGPFE